ncbi:MAG: amidase [Caldilineaceae bacterium]|nr:amidase [Caldilineaceae bacterium]
MTEFAYMPIVEVANLLEKREISPVELTRHLLDRIDSVDRRLHSYRTVLAERALQQARRAEKEIASGAYRGILHGVPIAVKDLVCTEGIPTYCGSTLMAGWLPDDDATVLRRLETAGAVLLGKLHMTEFALRWHHPAWPVPANPWGGDRWSGVSSSGSGVATAAGLCYASLGTDTGGSIRFPAACNGVVGLKPTYGRVSRYGVFPLAKSLDNVGPMTRSVADAAAMLGVIAGHDPNDPTSSHGAVPDYISLLDQDVSGLRLGVDERFIRDGVHPEVSEAVLQAVTRLIELGLQPVEVVVPAIDANLMMDTWSTLCAADAADAHRESWPARADEYGPFRQWLEFADTKSAADYAAAHTTRLEYAGKIAGVFEEVDLLACPAMPYAAPPIGDDALPLPDANVVRPRFTYPFNFSNSPTLTLPCGFTSDDLPIALQLVGPHFSEATLLRVGHAFERSTVWHKRVPLL